MRCFSKCLLVLGVAALIASPVFAQGRGGRGGFGGGAAMLVNNEAVQKELKLSEEEVTKAKEAVQEITEKFREEMTKARDLEGDEQRQKMREIMTKQGEETNAALAKVLKPEQVKRLKQIGVQQMGVMAFTSPDVSKVLKLTDEQKEKVTSIQMEQNEEMQGLRGNAGGDFQEMMKKMTTMRKEFTTKAVALLTPEQTKEWKELTGDSFDVPMGAGGRGGKRKKDKDGL